MSFLPENLSLLDLMHTLMEDVESGRLITRVREPLITRNPFILAILPAIIITDFPRSIGTADDCCCALHRNGELGTLPRNDVELVYSLYIFPGLRPIIIFLYFLGSFVFTHIIQDQVARRFNK